MMLGVERLLVDAELRRRFATAELVGRDVDAVHREHFVHAVPVREHEHAAGVEEKGVDVGHVRDHSLKLTRLTSAGRSTYKPADHARSGFRVQRFRVRVLSSGFGSDFGVRAEPLDAATEPRTRTRNHEQ